MAFDRRFLEELNERTDMVSLVSRYVHLEQKGGRWWGCCPFHSEKTPSFSVRPDKQMYYCFGCKAGGGAINFVMNIEKLEYRDAVEFLARLANIEVPKDERDVEEYKRKTRLLNLNKEAARFFFRMLSEDCSKEAREYMAKRQLSPQAVKRFGIGYSPNEWDALRNAMEAAGYSKDDLVAAGLCIKNVKGAVYDRFRNRLMFPIIDINGAVLGFGGRALDDSLPKYLNTSDTYIYHKARHLFAMNLAKHSKESNIILAEGYMDVVALHQAGFDNAVASLGTSLTSEQADLIKSRTSEVVIAYDGDSAGQMATERAIGIFKTKDIKVKVLKIADAKDPDEYIKKFGADAFRNMLSGSENSTDYRLEAIRKKYNIEDDEQKIAFLKEAVVLAASLRSGIEIEVYTGKLSRLTGISKETIMSEVRKNITAGRRKAEKKEIRDQSRPVSAAMTAPRGVRYKNITISRAFEGIIAIIAQNPELLTKVTDRLDIASIDEPALVNIFNAAAGLINSGVSVKPDYMAETLTDDEMKLFIAILASELANGAVNPLLNDYIAAIERETAVRGAQSGGADALDKLLELKRKDNRYGRN